MRVTHDVSFNFMPIDIVLVSSRANKTGIRDNNEKIPPLSYYIQSIRELMCHDRTFAFHSGRSSLAHNSLIYEHSHAFNGFMLRCKNVVLQETNAEISIHNDILDFWGPQFSKLGVC